MSLKNHMGEHLVIKSFLLMLSWKPTIVKQTAGDDGSRAWAPATHLGDQDGVPPPGFGLAHPLGEPVDGGSLCFSSVALLFQ